MYVCMYAYVYVYVSIFIRLSMTFLNIKWSSLGKTFCQQSGMSYLVSNRNLNTDSEYLVPPNEHFSAEKKAFQYHAVET